MRMTTRQIKRLQGSCICLPEVDNFLLQYLNEECDLFKKFGH